ncbi:DUF1642 domain-containing protein [Streptococcus oralis]|uniref:DUF1642 domain-containing protein n=1 Tax=Streptococcus oralis TaxID=1303 RepID=UPI003EE21CE9
MNKQELIERIEGLKNIFGNKCEYVKIDFMIKLVSELDEPEAGQTDEALRYVKNILARLRELPLHDREVWLKAIMGEFEQDFSHAKWREGYEQGKFEGEWVGSQLKDADKIRQELNKPVIPQFVADWLSNLKSGLFGLNYDSVSSEIYDWVYHTEDNIRKLHLAFVYGYEVEKEKRYRIKLKSNSEEIDYLVNTERNGLRFYSTIYTQRREHTRKELEEAGFGWMFDCPGIEIEEVE